MKSYKGNIFLEIGIALMAAVLVWSLLTPYLERQRYETIVFLTRSKMKTLYQLESLYFSQKSDYSVDAAKLAEFVMNAPPEVVPDTLFQPVKNAYQRWDDKREESPSLDQFIDSLFYNPMTGEKFVIEITSKDSKKTFTIKPSSREEDIKIIGAIIEGEMNWDERINRVR